MSNSIAPGSSADVNVRVTALTTNPNVPAQYKTIILKKNLVNGVNTLTQEMMSATNTKYVIKYNYVLGENITVPANCVLEFDGGSLSNGTLDGQFTIKDCNYHIFKNIDFVPNSTVLHNDFLRPEWFGAKGDFVYTTKIGYTYVDGIGTDDSAAFSYCIDTASKVRVNKIKLQAVTYYISSGIKIYSGGLIIEGEYASRNSYIMTDGNNPQTGNPNVKHDVTSCLFSNNCSAILDIVDNTSVSPTQKPAYPITIENISFINYPKNNKTAVGIHFGSTYEGPLYGFYIRGCYFKGFDKAINFDNGGFLAYLIFKVYIQFCAFYVNNWCVYFKEASGYNVDADDADNLANNTWDFHFTDNNATNNANVLNVEVWRGVCEVCRNNMENTEEYLPTDVWDENKRESTTKNQCYITLVDGATLYYKDNYCESLHIPPLRINTRGNVYLNVQNNCFYLPREKEGVVADVLKVDLKPIKSASSTVHINEWDDKLRIDTSNISNTNTQDLYPYLSIINNLSYVPKINIIGAGILGLSTNVIISKKPSSTCIRKLFISPVDGKEFITSNGGYAYIIAGNTYEDGIFVQCIEGAANDYYNEGINGSDVPIRLAIDTHSKDYKYSINIYRGNFKDCRLYVADIMAKSISAIQFSSVPSYENPIDIRDYLMKQDCDKINFGDTVNTIPTSL